MNMQPVILISGEEAVESGSGSQVFVLSRKYSEGVSRSGGLPLMPADIRATDEYADLADGLILTEGPPIHRGRYGKYYTSFEEIRTLSITRDEFEFALFHAFYRKGKPVLGIGRGMDIINTALGGSLQNLTKEEAKASPITVLPDTDLGKQFPRLPVPGKGREIKTVRLADALIAWALEADGAPVGFEQTGRPVFGIQWHPEWEKLILDDLLRYFIAQF
jgi:putative glutamine amidotransferase